ncbi:MAG: aminodeoxychorismate/anthranilate synthase component II [Dehalococcoidia bacterium]|nr:aminodeoxychorismate/anthranilate synthase component II [Dehalococcoidia bacterium]
MDNYDSFTYNLVQYIGELGGDPVARRNDAISLRQIFDMAPTHIVISPGPCTPLEAGISNDVVRYFAGEIPILGVCLGHQCIGHVYGGRIVGANIPMHGKTSLIHHDGRTIYRRLPASFLGGRYHSLVVEPESLPSCLEVSAWSDSNEIMGLRHKDYVVEGVQFHPESVMTKVGHDLLGSFLDIDRPVWG